MTNRFGFDLHPKEVRWAAAEGVTEDVIAAVLLLHERSVEEIVPQLSPLELEKVIMLVGRSPRLYPRGILEALDQHRSLTASVPMSSKEEATPSARSTHPPRGNAQHSSRTGPDGRQSPTDSAKCVERPWTPPEPKTAILIARGKNAPHGLGFAPHGAGRNFSRTAYERQNVGKTAGQMIKEQTGGLDIRFFCGVPGVSELPMAYKSAVSVRAQIDEYDLAEVVDTIEPMGCLMAGDWQAGAPWRKKRAKNGEV